MRILLLTAMMIFASSVSAGLYKWVDNEGNVHYSQKRPINKQFKSIKPPPVVESGKSLYNSTQTESEPDDTIKAETKKNAKIRADNCAVGKENLNKFQTYRRMKNKDGTVVNVDAKERARQIENAKQIIRDFCD